jgi:glycine dehydrogenase subunit 2
MAEPAGRASSAPLAGGGEEPLLIELGSSGRGGAHFGPLDVPEQALDLPQLADDLPGLPEVSERDLVAHFTRLAHRNFAVDLGAYPLGSCTMKYNPKICDWAAESSGFRDLHPAAPAELAQGALQVIAATEEILCELTGMARATFQPAAGAAGELTGLLLFRAYHHARGARPTKVLIPDSAHGTNPASASLAGYEAVHVPSNEHGLVDVAALRSLMGEDVAGLMLTNPNTLGLFEEEITTMADIVHDAGGLLYYDGANLNAILGKARPGDMGFDIVHSNLHKTFATPHGGGGPGSGPIAVIDDLVRFLPGPLPERDADGRYRWVTPQDSIGRVHGNHGNFLVVLRAYTYMRALGGAGLERVAERSVLNARYLAELLENTYQFPFPKPCMHEFVASAAHLKKETGVRAFDIAKALPDYGFHAPTMYFPLIVEEALMVEPTETESPQTVEALADALIDIASRAVSEPEVLHGAPHRTPVGRPDEATAARKPVLNWST